MKLERVSVKDDFFELGGNSLIAIGLASKINKELRLSLPLQVLFECPTIEKLALKIEGELSEPSSRLVPLHAEGTKSPVFCWPGLGGYTLNLRLLASKISLDRPFYGVQAHGINRGEIPFATIAEMAADDVKSLKRLQPTGPYTLWGYSFGARVAFEAAYQLEQAGARVENIFLIAPGSPEVRAKDASSDGSAPSFRDEKYVTILFSVFAGRIAGRALNECLRVARDEEAFVSFITEQFKNLDSALVRRIVKIVSQTYEFKYSFRELAERRLNAPITIFKARGDDYSFIESSSGYSSQAASIIDLDADHYGMLKQPGLEELLTKIRGCLGTGLPQAPLYPALRLDRDPEPLSWAL